MLMKTEGEDKVMNDVTGREKGIIVKSRRTIRTCCGRFEKAAEGEYAQITLSRNGGVYRAVLSTAIEPA